MDIVILGLSITSSWGNGHATTYRGFVRALAERNHRVMFLERDVPWYAANRDLPDPPYGVTKLYSSLEELKNLFSREIREADVVVVGSFVPEGVPVGEWVLSAAKGLRIFYDIDTPVTLRKLESGDGEYISRELIPAYDLYLSFTGGPVLRRLEQSFGARRTGVLYCSVDPELYYPDPCAQRWDLGYLGTYSQDRQQALDSLMLEPARRWTEGKMIVAGSLYPAGLEWPANVARVEHLPPAEHRGFYNQQRFTLSLTRVEMRQAGYSPSVRLFEAAACGTPIITDSWPGIEDFFRVGSEILITRSGEETLSYLRELPEAERLAIAQRGRERTLSAHTAAHRAREFEACVKAC